MENFEDKGFNYKIQRQIYIYKINLACIFFDKGQKIQKTWQIFSFIKGQKYKKTMYLLPIKDKKYKKKLV